MPDFDAEMLAEHAVMLGLVKQEDAQQARLDADDPSPEALVRSMLRKGLLTSWQIERLQKSDPSGFFYGGCKVLFHLAEGTFARVYRGERLLGGKPVAIKVLRQRFVSDPDAVARFHKEAEAGMRLVHPNIVQILDYGEEDKRHFMIMEYVEGSNLRELLKIRTRVDPAAALPLMKGLVEGLKYAIEQGVTHRDIKGTNILIGNSGVGKLVDFGLATIQGEDKKKASLNQRTVDYSALERTCGSQKGDPRSDVYFLGCVFYQMITGQLPMVEVESSDPLAKMLKRSFGAIKPLGEHRHAPDAELTRIIGKMMKVDLKERYQSMAEVLGDLEIYEKHTGKVSSAGSATADVDSAEVIEFEYENLFTYKPEEPTTGNGVAAGAGAGAAGLQSAQHEGTALKAAPAAPLKQVLCVEKQPEIQDALRKSLAKMGYRAILVSDPEHAAERYRESPPDGVLFDVDGIGAEGLEFLIDMHDKAHEDERDLSALVLLGPKQQALKEKLPTDDRLIVLVKPIKMKDVQQALNQLVPLEK